MPEGDRDVLTAALQNSEHGGRTRGRPFGVGKRQSFGTQAKASTRDVINRREHEAVVSELRASVSRVEKLVVEALRSKSQPSATDIATPTTRHVSTGGSNSPDDRDFDNGMVRLYVEPSKLVGYDTSYPDRHTHHTILLPTDQIVVTVVVVREDAPLPLPEPGEVDTVQMADD